MIQNEKILSWIEEMKALVKPDKVVWIDGSQEQIDALPTGNEYQNINGGEVL